MALFSAEQLAQLSELFDKHLAPINNELQVLQKQVSQQGKLAPISNVFNVLQEQISQNGKLLDSLERDTDFLMALQTRSVHKPSFFHRSMR